MLAGGADAMVDLHYIGTDTAERFKRHAAAGAADAFQAFLEDALHPAIGGLIATNVALNRFPLLGM